MIGRLGPCGSLQLDPGYLLGINKFVLWKNIYERYSRLNSMSLIMVIGSTSLIYGRLELHKNTYLILRTLGYFEL